MVDSDRSNLETLQFFHSMLHLGWTFTTFLQPPRCGDVRWKTRATTPLIWWYSQNNGVFKASPMVTTKIQNIRHGVPLRTSFPLPSTGSLLLIFFRSQLEFGVCQILNNVDVLTVPFLWSWWWPSNMFSSDFDLWRKFTCGDGDIHGQLHNCQLFKLWR